MNLSLQFFIDNIFGVLFLIIAFTNLSLSPIKMRNKLCMAAGISIITIFLYPVCGEFSTYLVIYYTVFVSVIGQKKKFQICILGIMGYIYNVFLNYLCVTIIYVITDIYVMKLSWLFRSLFNICYILLLYVTTAAIKRIFRKQLDFLFTHKFNIKFVINICLFIAVCACILITNFATGQYMGYPLFSYLLNCFLFLLYFSLSVIILYHSIKTIKQDTEKKQKILEYQKLQEYTTKLEDLYQQMRSFKHDYINILATLDCYIEQGDLDSLEDYFHSKILPTGKQFSQDSMSIGRLANIQILELKSLLYQKFMRASSLHLQLDIDIPSPLTSIGSVEPVDLSRLIGIFLDNAIEAASETEEKKLFCGFLQNEDNIIIRLTNSCNATAIPIEKLYENGFTTKILGHGIGLYNAKEILNKYPVVMHFTECKDSCFTQELLIPQS